MGAKAVVNSNNISGLIERTLNYVDPRLVDHGKRVASLVYGMLEVQKKYSAKEVQDICILAMLHDIGAYKTEEINRMAQFEPEDIWEHSIYGYLFLADLSPLKEWARAVMFHHVVAVHLPDTLEERIREAAQMICLADRIDIYLQENKDPEKLFLYLDRVRGSKFDSSILDLFYKAEEQFSMLACLEEEKDFHTILPNVRLSEQECEDYLRMMIFAIDFRSQHTVTHTITTTRISCCAARHMGLSGEQIHNIYYGALLHDLGKIGIPVEILEYPGRLSSQAMAIMRTHVDLTEKILGGTIEEKIMRIALRHHEKLDGSGYPRGLSGEELTIEERIVAVSDIVSALLGTRSYKEAFSRERTLSIIEEQAREGKIDRSVVEVLKENFDTILEEVEEGCRPVLDTYYGLRKDYQYLLGKYLYNGAESAVDGKKES